MHSFHKINDRLTLWFVRYQVGLGRTSNLTKAGCEQPTRRNKPRKAKFLSFTLVGAFIGVQGTAYASACTTSSTSEVVQVVDNGITFLAAVIGAASVLMLLLAVLDFIG